MVLTPKTESKLVQLKAILEGHQAMLIVMQDNPDPDSIAAAVALRKLANTLANTQCSIAHGGTVGRGENRALVRYLGLNLRQIDQLDMKQFELFAIVDTQPGTGNNSLPSEIEPDIVIDHHPCRQQTRHSRFTDIRSKYGATATILLEYLDAANITPDVPLATAMLYAIRSDTQDLGRDTTKADIKALTALYAIANKRMLSEIQRGKVSRDYFQMMADALKNAQVFANAIVTNLGQIENPDMIAEVADILLRDDQTNWVMVTGYFKHKMMVSLRTYEENVRADKIIHGIVARKGTGGGHPSYAGGQIPLKDNTKRTKDRLEKTVLSRFLKQVVKDSVPKQPLIQK
ncbi:MAG: bifunctional oligoribonuclease/PAP phosphatase NrnA [Phycisphaerae bacterium]|nr:bifunctional oligoribonuclease/PAP phosphatase NrnA [Phycisphaerae bacterium]